ncbi:MAG: FtsX-like permease family protein [Vicinamibacterales bacterium]
MWCPIPGLSVESPPCALPAPLSRARTGCAASRAVSRVSRTRTVRLPSYRADTHARRLGPRHTVSGSVPGQSIRLVDSRAALRGDCDRGQYRSLHPRQRRAPAASPFEEPERLVMVALREPDQPATHPFALRGFRGLAAASTSTVALLARTFLPSSLAAGDGTRMVQAEFVSGNYFNVLRLEPQHGRFFDEDDDRPAAPIAVVLSDRLWRTRFGGDKAVVGRVMRVNGRAVTVAGIAPVDFVGATRLVHADLWCPAAVYAEMARTADADAVPIFGVIGRLADGITRLEAAERLTGALAAVTGAGSTRSMVVVTEATGFGHPAARPAVTGLSTAAYVLMGLLIAVASANVAALMLARTVGRQPELAIRVSLGASRWQVARTLVVECAMLAWLGSAGGAIVALWLTQALVAQVDTPFEYVTYALDVRPDLRVLFSATVAAAAAVVICSLAPLRAVSRIDLQGLLSAGPTPGGSPGPLRLFHALVIVQLAASTVLLLAAGVVTRSYLHAQDRSVSVDTRGLISGTLTLSNPAARPLREADGLLARLADPIARLPGVGGVAWSRESVLGSGRSIRITGESPTAAMRAPLVAMEFRVSAAYAQVVGLDVIQGRGLDGWQLPDSRRVVVNSAMAHRLAADGSAVGRRFTSTDGDTEPFEVVGVVSDFFRDSAERLTTPTFYRALPADLHGQVTVIVRANGALSSIVGDVRRAVQAVDADIAVADLQSVEALLEIRARQQRLPTLVFGVVGGAALLLSTVGLFGVMAYGVRRRAREIGVLQALGASPSEIRRQVLGRGFAVVGVALLLGLGVAAAARVVAHSAVFGLAPISLDVVILVCGVLLLASGLALALPARWAARVDPATLIRRP